MTASTLVHRSRAAKACIATSSRGAKPARCVTVEARTRKKTRVFLTDPALRRIADRAGDADVPAATATHADHPAEAVWLPGGGFERVALYELCSDHGSPIAGNANYRDGQLDL
jgi:hypothetical protein